MAPLFGLVHLPLFFITGGLIDNGPPEGAQIFEYAFYLLILCSVPVRILVTWVYNSTGGSLPVVALLHASIDATASTAMFTTFYPGGRRPAPVRRGLHRRRSRDPDHARTPGISQGDQCCFSGG